MIVILSRITDSGLTSLIMPHKLNSHKTTVNMGPVNICKAYWALYKYNPDIKKLNLRATNLILRTDAMPSNLQLSSHEDPSVNFCLKHPRNKPKPVGNYFFQS